jgi:predicted ATPase/class 3 adenylate cyclase/Flp pilus assembly protein TadD
MGRELSGNERKRFEYALLSAFPDSEDLDQMLAHQMGIRLAAITTADNLINLVFEVVDWAHAQGRVEELIAAALAANPDNPHLQSFASQAHPAGPPEVTAAAPPLPRPSGTVTFLFTDIEGSTRLWEEYPDLAGAAIIRHDTLLRTTIEYHKGYVFKTVGDAFCAAFTTAAAAVAAAVAAQRALAATPWPAPVGPIQVRMGLHTGMAEERDGDYFGPNLNRVARLMSAGHGGQILLSRATEELVRDRLPPGVTLRNLGEQRLKDLIRPESIFQVVAPDMVNEFPPLKTLERKTHNLPRETTAFIGRERETAALIDLLRQREVALVTLTGYPGVGKTRLSLHVVEALREEFAEGIWFIEFSAISDPAEVAGTIMDTLHVREVGGSPPLETLTGYLQDKQILLVLDNFDRVVAAGPAIITLLENAPGLKMLISSGTALEVQGEHIYRVASLSLPNMRQPLRAAELLQYEAVRLFVERAGEITPGFALTDATATAIAGICVRLDGLPLALELAAARTRLLTPQAILARLDHRLNLLTGGPRDLPARHRTLRAALTWSHELLDPSAQILFRRLALFPDGATLEAIEAVCITPGANEDVLNDLNSLVTHSLVQRKEQDYDETRFTMLETIREYAAEQLQGSGEIETLMPRYVAYYRTRAEAAERGWEGADQAVWMARMEMDHSNVRAALQWTYDQRWIAEGLALAAALYRPWWTHGHTREGQEWLAAFLAHADEQPPAARARALQGAGTLARGQDNYSQSAAWLEEAVAIYRQENNLPALAGSLIGLTWTYYYQGIQTPAMQYGQESLAITRQLGHPTGIAAALHATGWVALSANDDQEAERAFNEALTLSRQFNNSRAVANILNSLGEVARLRGDLALARARYGESLKLHRNAHQPLNLAMTLHNLGHVSVDEDHLPEAAAYFHEALHLFYEIGNKIGIAQCLLGLGVVANAGGHPERAAHLFAAGEALREQVGVPLHVADQAEVSAHIARAQAQADPEQWASGVAAGQAMTLEQAVLYGLETSA